MKRSEEARIADRAIADVLLDWRYKAGIEEGQRRRGPELRLLESERDLALTALYQADPVACAALCDETFDRTGALLGKVREWANEKSPTRAQGRRR